MKGKCKNCELRAECSKTTKKGDKERKATKTTENCSVCGREIKNEVMIVNIKRGPLLITWNICRDCYSDSFYAFDQTMLSLRREKFYKKLTEV